MEMRPLHAHYPPAHSHFGGWGDDAPGREGTVPENETWCQWPPRPDQEALQIMSHVPVPGTGPHQPGLGWVSDLPGHAYVL